MKNSSNYTRTVGGLTILSGILAAVSIFLGAHAVEYNLEAFSEPVLVLQYAHNYRQAYRFLLLDMAGYYLFLLPAIFYLHQRYKFQSPWMQLLTFSGTAYVLIGAIGAAMLAAAWPEMMQQYMAATKDRQDAIVLLFTMITNIVTKGLWNILEVLFAATWWVGIGLLIRRDYQFMGLISIIAGVACLLDSIGTMSGLKVLSETGVNVYLLSGILWPIVVGIQLIRKSSVRRSANYPVATGAFTSKEETPVKA